MSNAIARRIADLERYLPELTAKPDIDTYWDDVIAAFADKPLNAVRAEVETPFPQLLAYRVEYEGFDDTRIHGWFLLPRGMAGERLPCTVIFHGYTGGKGYPEQYAQYALMGMAVFAVDVRGQGGDTGNHLQQAYGMTRGWVTQGILTKDSFYYKAISLDALKALEWAAGQTEVDETRICVEGESQGGGLAFIAAALSTVPAIAVAHIPNMCHMDYGILNSQSSLTEAAEFAARFPDKLDTIMETLSYFDNMNLAHRIRIPLFVTVGLKDLTTMPETIYAAYNRVAAPKEIRVYPFSGHTVGGDQNRQAIEFIRTHFFNF
ncbi:acetylxylan esterase [Cohnella nanjingensis]|uniref:Acetylxylan esterase n=1 Tax=Cohnella nanjingensis TaxID=1387779 RepID=A0A7X0RXE5_9BACL|nr:alpha/beta fold hydrolase [Cohnella nanjingensis]MBB6675434.1 acetylxylan esterase [Cohnella nanjingensis]